MNPRDLLHIHLELECIGIDASGHLRRIPGPDPDAIPRLYAARFAGGHVAYCRDDVEDALCSRWHALPPDVLFGPSSQVVARLGQPLDEVWAGYSSVFTREPPAVFAIGAERLTALGLTPANRAILEDLDSELDPDTRRIFGVFQEGRLVSMCASTRENATAAEAWVKTVPESRGRGYAFSAVAAWARSVMGDGKLAFYSYRADNRASQAVARSLGLVPFIQDVAFE